MKTTGTSFTQGFNLYALDGANSANTVLHNPGVSNTAALGQEEAVKRFCALFLDGDDADICAAVDALSAYRNGDAVGASQAEPMMELEAAEQTVAKHLSPNGKEALLQSIGGGAGDSEFSELFSLKQRYCLAARTHLNQVDDTVHLSNYARAVKDLQAAAALYTLAGMHAQSAEAALQAAGIIARWGKLDQAASLYLKIAQACEGTGQRDAALKAYQEAVKAFWLYAAVNVGPTDKAPEGILKVYKTVEEAGLRAAAIHESSGELQLAQDAYLWAAEARRVMADVKMQRGRHWEAGEDYLRVVQALKRIGKDTQALEVTMKAAQAFRASAEQWLKCEDRLDLAAQGFWESAKALEREGLPGAEEAYRDAAKTFEAFANWHLKGGRAGRHHWASQAFMDAGKTYALAGLSGPSKHAYGQAAHAFLAYAQSLKDATGDHEALALLNAGKAFDLSGLSEEAQSAYLQSSTAFWGIVKAHFMAGRRPQAEQALKNAAEVDTLANLTQGAEMAKRLLSSPDLLVRPISDREWLDATLKKFVAVKTPE
ncbi:hypothetical protein [Pandoraea oxalativorans]|uniref:Uncharacterized protein n=1 Tax=Pandoraea oxalativorans TaxID=573737 RepID=A0A0G3IDH8_9BURK|nr:hypothetical protein [Pandoraea oxalativorans]AKK24658.1 hypothetical protein MB84_27870 [Pandoraea oxalativorans]